MVCTLPQALWRADDQNFIIFWIRYNSERPTITACGPKLFVRFLKQILSSANRNPHYPCQYRRTRKGYWVWPNWFDSAAAAPLGCPCSLIVLRLVFDQQILEHG